MKNLIVLALFLWFPGMVVILRNALEDTLLWQLKEYRLDRMTAHMKDTHEPQFRGSKNMILKITLLLLSFAFFVLPSNLFLLIPIIIYYIYTLDFIHTFHLIKKKILKRPRISPRNILIILLFLAVLIIIIMVMFKYFSLIIADNSNNVLIKETLIQSLTSLFVEKHPVIGAPIIPITTAFIFINFIIILLCEILEPLIVFLLVILTAPIATIKRELTILKAKIKIMKFNNLKIIGITGSYGKTSTKEILAKILSTKYNVVATPGNVNTAIGIAQTILNKINQKTEVFIVEMGAYRKGEIKKAAKLTPPDISIITNIGKSHLSIFKTVQNIAKTKFEIIEQLKNDGIAILNADNSHTYAMKDKIDKKTVLYSLDEEKEFEPDQYFVKIKNIEESTNESSFTVELKNNQENMATNIIGSHNLKNLAPAIAAAIHLGLSSKQIKDILKDAILKTSHFQIYNGKKNTKIIDDSYNTNPDGFGIALEHLKQLENKTRILITKGIPEIGKEIQYIYENLSKQIIEICDVLITSDQVLCEEISKQDTNELVCHLVKDTHDMNENIKKYIKKNTVFLIEGRVNPETIKLLKKTENEN
ncbi:hypothetical protein GF362_07565 [Candidatus Dojkabacteria bacterium]|nr:hypothetical protein [Candidatus Dojkabacteria bacterium]